MEQLQEGGRTNQKARTRKEMLVAASSMLREGVVPSVAEVAEVAGVSRATAYRYFPTQQLLLVEATLDGIVPDMRAMLADPAVGRDAESRLDALVETVHQMVTTNEAAFRALLQHALASSPGKPASRGSRRVEWLELALSPIRPQFTADQFRRLNAVLSLFIGIETQVVLRDICHLDLEETEEAAHWAARALLRAALAEALTGA